MLELEDLWKNNLLTPTKINIFNNNNINVMEDLWKKNNLLLTQTKKNIIDFYDFSILVLLKIILY